MQILGLNISFAKKRVYEASDKSRRGKPLRLARSTNADAELYGAISTIRNRSRHMVRNNGWAKRAVEAVVKNTVGEGIRPAPITTQKKKKQLAEIWTNWANTTQCDWYENSTLYGLQELAMRSIVEGGETLIIKRWVNDGDGLPLRLQLCEGDQIDTTKNGINEKGIARMGVQFDKNNRKIGYWLYDNHPGDNTPTGSFNESQYVDKSDVLHVFEVLRIGQSRGLPFGVASFMKLSDFSDYEDAQLMKQKVAACFSAFVAGGDPSIFSEDADDVFEYLEPGTINYLKEGETVEFADPPSVGDYNMYSNKILQGVASAYGITYEMLTTDYSNVNFTSGRMAKMDVSANFRSWQYNMLVPMMCSPIWEWFMDACIISGAFAERVKSDWTAPRIRQIDPGKETGAQIEAIEGGLSTLSETIRENGRDPEEFFEEYASDMKRLKELGVNITSVNTTGQTEQQTIEQ